MSAPRIDAHLHVWDLARRPQPWTAGLPVLERSFPVAEVAPALAEHAPDGAVVVHTVADAAETRELLELAAVTPAVAGVVGWFDLTAGGLGTRLDEALAGPGGTALVGARHQLQVEPDPQWLGRDDVRRGLAELGRRDLVYDVVVSWHQLPLVVRTARELPGVRFVLDHAGKPDLHPGADLEPWARDLTALAGCPNVAVKVSGLVTEADWAAWTPADLRPAVEVLLAGFGADRLMFGSDWPVCLLAGGYDRWVEVLGELTAGLAAPEREALWGGTAARWYRCRAGR